MKKFLLLISVSSMLLIISCNNEQKGELSDAAQKNLDAFNEVSKCFETKDFSRLGDYVAEDAIDHGGQEGEIIGLANWKSEFEKWSANTEGDKNETIVALANDDYVMAWMRFTGKTKVDQMGSKAGENFDIRTVEIAKFKNGKVVEHWVYLDPAEMMKMMGGAGGETIDSSMHAKDSTTN